MIILYFFQELIGLIFLTSMLHKIFYWKNHIDSMVKYKILKEGWVLPFALFFMTCEAFISLSLIFTGINFYNFLCVFLILVVYSLAVIINLSRGHKMISCGCGGVLENKQLNLGIVLRNLLLISIIFLLFIFEQKDFENPLSYIQKTICTMLSIYTLIIITLLKEAKHLKKVIKKINQRMF